MNTDVFHFAVYAREQYVCSAIKDERYVNGVNTADDNRALGVICALCVFRGQMRCISSVDVFRLYESGALRYVGSAQLAAVP